MADLSAFVALCCREDEEGLGSEKKGGWMEEGVKQTSL